MWQHQGRRAMSPDLARPHLGLSRPLQLTANPYLPQHSTISLRAQLQLLPLGEGVHVETRGPLLRHRGAADSRRAAGAADPAARRLSAGRRHQGVVAAAVAGGKSRRQVPAAEPTVRQPRLQRAAGAGGGRSGEEEDRQGRRICRGGWALMGAG